MGIDADIRGELAGCRSGCGTSTQAEGTGGATPRRCRAPLSAQPGDDPPRGCCEASFATFRARRKDISRSRIVVLYVQDRDRVRLNKCGAERSCSRRICAKLPGGAQTSLGDQDGLKRTRSLVGMRAVGAIAWRPASLSREVATAVSAQVGIALTRAIAIEATARMEASRERRTAPCRPHRFPDSRVANTTTSIRAAATTLTQDEGLDDESRKELATIVDEESARLDALIGEAVEMAETRRERAQGSTCTAPYAHASRAMLSKSRAPRSGGTR